MAEIFNIIDTNKTVLYAFRFGTSDKLVHLTQQELNHIPYLLNLVAHKDDFLLAQNKNGEYVLNHPIEYNWFMSILRSITVNQPYTLFNELAEDDNVLDTLQLFDYLGINSFPLPLLKYKSLVLSNPNKTDDDKKHIVYHKANISEARQTAAEFIIALSKNEYDLNDFDTLNNIYSLIKTTLSNAAIFNSRFRHHTLIVVEECCYSFFSKKQRRLLPTIQQIAQHRKIDSLIYLYDDDKLLSDDFYSTLAWRGTYVSKEDNRPNYLSATLKSTSFSSSSGRTSHTDDISALLAAFQNITLEMEKLYTIALSDIYDKYYDKWCVSSREELPIYQIKQNRKNNEAQSARSGRFNTLPKRSKVDKFKHRRGPKAQKYR